MNSRFSLLITALLFVCTFAGCATVTKEEVAARFEPLPANYQQLTKDCLAKTFVRPDTAVYRFQEPRRGYDQAGFLADGKKRFGWVVPVRVKAKNLLGFYLPERPHYVSLPKERLTIAPMYSGR